MLGRPFSLCLFLLNGLPLCGILPMGDQWRSATVALSNGKAAEAASAFEAFSSWYGEEPAAREPVFQEALLRLWTIAAIGAGQYPKALDLMAAWMPGRSVGDPFHSFFLFQQIRLHLALEQLPEFEDRAAAFLLAYPELPERCLVRWYLAKSALLQENRSMARQQWEAILQDAALPALGRELARGAMALLELHEGQALQAFTVLEGAGEHTPILKRWRTYLAPALTTQLLDAELPELAVEATSWLNPSTAFGLDDEILSAHSPSPSRHSLRNAIWQSHWNQETRHLGSLLGREDPQLLRDYGLRLRALRLAGRFRPVRNLAQALIASRAALPPDLLAMAYREGIEALLAEAQWLTAQAWIDAFIEASPNDPALPAMRLMAARALAGQQDWKCAIRGVESLLHDWPNHPSALTWAFLRGVWLLGDHQPAEALQQLEGLAAKAPDSWRPLIGLQQAKGLHATGQTEAALHLLQLLARDNQVPANIRESAALEELKLRLLLTGPEFDAALRYYRETFPEGRLAAMVETLAGTCHLARGEWEQASRIWQSVAALPIREAAFARQQLIRLLPQRRQWDTLRREVVRWLRLKGPDLLDFPTEALEGAHLYQEKTGSPALPPDLLTDLLGALETGRQGLPPLLCLDLFEGAWPHYDETLGAAETPFATWLEHLASPLNPNPRTRSIARLHLAERLEREGRTDSADALRMGVLQDEPGQPWEPEPAFILARTADRYDFPDAAERLHSFIVRSKSHRRYPDSLFLLANRMMRDARPEDARPLLKLILIDWADSPLALQSTLQLADLHLEAGQPNEAQALLEPLLARRDLEPELIAQALEQRLQAELSLNNLENALLTGIRLLSIYPNFGDICRRSVDRIRSTIGPMGLDPEMASLRDTIEILLLQLE